MRKLVPHSCKITYSTCRVHKFCKINYSWEQSWIFAKLFTLYKRQLCAVYTTLKYGF